MTPPLERTHSAAVTPWRRQQLVLLIETCDCGASEDQARRVFVALRHERNATLRHEVATFSVQYHRSYETTQEFRQAYAEWTRALVLFRQTSFECWIKEHYQQTIWRAALEAASRECAMHLDDFAEHASLTDATARHYEVPYRHRLSFSGQSAETSSLYFVLYTADATFCRREDWVVERDAAFWNCFYCIPRAIVWRIYGAQAPSRRGR